MFGLAPSKTNGVPHCHCEESTRNLPYLGGVWDCSTNSTVEQLHKKLEFVEHLFRCSHNSTLFPRTECVELKPFG